MSKKLSACLIVRDVEQTLENCLRSIQPAVDELVVVDTGSVDQTREIAKRLGAKLHGFAWCDDFAQARNMSLLHATGDWIFWMDADDTIDERNASGLRLLAEQEHPESLMGFVMQVHCPAPFEHGVSQNTVVDHIKVFRNLPEIQFEGRIHEQVLPSIRRLGGEIGWTDLFVVHSGADHSPVGRQKKLERDLRILELDLEDRPDHPFVLFNLGMTYANAGDDAQAVRFLERALETAGPDDSHLRKVYALLISSCRRLERHDRAEQLCRQGRARFPDDPELLFLEAVMYQSVGRFAEAERSYKAIFEVPRQPYFASVDGGITGYKARCNLAAVYQSLARPADAEEQLWLALEEVPAYRDAWRALLPLLVEQGKSAQAAVHAQRMAADPVTRRDGLVLLAHVHEARDRVPDACRVLTEVVEEFPDDLEALDELCRLSFAQGAASAERWLSRLIECSPEDGAAHHNLGTVYLRQGRLEEAITRLRESLELRPEAPHTHLYLGIALAKSGQSDAATEAWEAARRFDPEGPIGERAAKHLTELQHNT